MPMTETPDTKPPQRVILRNVSVSDFVLAGRAVRWLEERPDVRDTIISFGDGPDDERLFYVRRNKSSIAVIGQTPANRGLADD